jgi:N-acetylmuramoyl-L-alanine amidase
MRWTDLRPGERSRRSRFEELREFCKAGQLTRAASPLLVAMLVCGAFLRMTAQQIPQSTSATQSSSAPIGSAPPQTSIPPASKPIAPQLRFVVVLDPAHGGSDTGAILSSADLEKNYTLALAVRLHVLLNGRGIQSILTRDTDTMDDNTARAETANRTHAAACILLHATSTGNGVHLFTSSLQTVRQADPRRVFLPWPTAQASYGTQSLRLESDINASLTRQHIPVLLDKTSLAPLDSMACPAIAVEVAPLNAATPVSNSAYQEEVAESLASALAEWHSDWKLQP